jgi:Phosphoenolpyruvate carboxylase
MTSWYGLGTALNKLSADQWQQVQAAADTDPFLRYVLHNVDTSLARCDTEVMAQYAALVDDSKIRQSFLAEFQEELRLCREQFDRLLGGAFAERHPRHYHSDSLRFSLLPDLHREQIELLKRWRQRESLTEAEQESLQTQLLLSINAIAGALGHTG